MCAEDLPLNGSAPSQARGLVRNALDRRGRTSDDAELIISELVTNAVRYALTRVRLSLSMLSETLLIKVSDDGPGRPAAQSPLPEAVSGNGLRLVAALTSRWGVYAFPGGKTVWCEVTVPGLSAAPRRVAEPPSLSPVP